MSPHIRAKPGEIAPYVLMPGDPRRAKWIAALAICTVSDHMVTGEETTAAERQETFGDMVEVALTAMLG